MTSSASAPKTLHRDRSILENLIDEITNKLQIGEKIDLSAYAREHPKYATLLREVVPTLEMLAVLGQSASHEAGGSGFDPLVGVLGDYRILREIGRGGMGVVYEAEQISLGRRVALKVLPFASTLDSKHLQRFKNEAHAAAQLHHTNIVPVFATGCERGVHYYAMQFIEGQTLAAVITDMRESRVASAPGAKSEDKPANRLALAPGVKIENCGLKQESGLAQSRQAAEGPLAPSRLCPSQDEQALTQDYQPVETPPKSTLEARASTVDTGPMGFRSSILDLHSTPLFRSLADLAQQVAEALDHAHEQGIIHRDIKPSNLMLDVRGKVWITDFGLAHVPVDKSLTMTGDLIGTLRYMSPEQALAKRVIVDHRTDIYSLGATLYELLTLRPPYEGNDRQELLRQIAFEEPKPPRRLNKTIPQELETIVVKAMEKYPADRYATAQDLADDLRCFLEDRPIKVKRTTSLQKARRWARRHLPVVWSAAIALFVALAVLAGCVGWVVRDRAARHAKIASELQAALEEAQRSRREGKWPRAQAAAKRAEGLLQDAPAAPELAKRVQDLLSQLAGEEADRLLVARLEELRLLQAEVNVQEDRFVLERAIPDYRDAFSSYGLQVDAMTPDDAAALIRHRPAAVRATLVAALDHWLILARHQKASDAHWLEQLLALADSDAWRHRLRSARSTDDREALQQLARKVDVTAQPPEALFLLDRALHQRGAQEGAVALLRRAQEAFPSDFWINHNLGWALQDCRPPQYEEAIRFLTAAVALRPESAGARLNLGLVLSKTGRLDEAIVAFRKAIELKSDYVMAHNNLGCALGDKGLLDEALAAFRRAIDLKPDFALGRANFGRVLWQMGRKDEALAAFREAVRLKPDLAEAQFNLGLALVDKGCLDEALAVYRQLIKLRPDYAEAHCNLGNVLERKCRLDEALDAYHRAISLKPDLITAEYNLGRTFQKKGQLDEAVAAYRRVIHLKADHAGPHYDLGNALRDSGQFGEAVAAYRRAIELNPAYAEAYCNLGLVLRQQGEFAAALAALKRGSELGARRPDWHYPSARWLRECERLGELKDQLPAVLRGETRPASAAEWNAYSLLCYDKKLYRAAARLRDSALTAEPMLADDLEADYRYDAASAAALAGCGQGADAGQSDDKERIRWRNKALEWLRADLTKYGNLLDSGTAENRMLVQQRLRQWQRDQDLAGLRDPGAVAKLPADEQKMCQQLWAEVLALLTKADVAK